MIKRPPRQWANLSPADSPAWDQRAARQKAWAWTVAAALERADAPLVVPLMMGPAPAMTFTWAEGLALRWLLFAARFDGLLPPRPLD